MKIPTSGHRLAPVIMASVLLWAAAFAQEQPQKEAATQMPGDGPRTTGFQPLDYFQNQCARCHGDYGAAYGPTFGAKLTDENMRKVVGDMADGPAQSSLTPAALDAQTAFHKALRDKQTFVVVVAWSSEGVLSGEALPGTKLWLEIGGKKMDIPLDGHVWKIQLSPAPAWKETKLHAQKDGKETVIPLAERAY